MSFMNDQGGGKTNPPNRDPRDPNREYNLDDLQPGPIQRELTQQETDRINNVWQRINKLAPSIAKNLEDFERGFMRDQHPSREITIWENIVTIWENIATASEAVIQKANSITSPPKINRNSKSPSWRPASE